MSIPSVTQQQILDAIRHVPHERWDQVLHVIESFQTPSTKPASTLRPVRTGKDLQGSDLIGIWADRPELTDSGEFARRLRNQAEHRHHERSQNAVGH